MGSSASCGCRGEASQAAPAAVDVGDKGEKEAPVPVTIPASLETKGSDDNVIRVKPSLQLKDPKAMTKSGSIKDAVSPEQVLEYLMDGNRRFLAGECMHPHQDIKRILSIAGKQHPVAAILGCADSRVPAEIVFDQGFGDVFVCRVAGNIVSPEVLASLEYAVVDLGVKLMVILGHTSCGAIKAAMSGNSFPGFIDALVDQLDVAVERSKVSFHRKAHQHHGHSVSEVDHTVRENVIYQIKRAKRSKVIQNAMKDGKLLVVGGVYHLDTGEVELISAEDEAKANGSMDLD